MPPRSLRPIRRMGFRDPLGDRTIPIYTATLALRLPGVPTSVSIIGSLKSNAQFLRGSEPASGPGKALVLDALDRTGSISAAGRDPR